MAAKKPFKTWIEGELPVEIDPAKLAPIERYQTPDDVPVALRHTLCQSVESGLTPAQLAKIYEIPEAWIELFAKPAQGSG